MMVLHQCVVYRINVGDPEALRKSRNAVSEHLLFIRCNKMFVVSVKVPQFSLQVAEYTFSISAVTVILLK